MPKHKALRHEHAGVWADLRHELKKNKLLFIMLLPAIAYYIIFKYIPMTGIILAFKKYTYAGGIWGSPFNNFNNFTMLFAGGNIVRIVRNTVLYNISWLFLNMFLEVTIAIFISMMVGEVYKKICQSAMLLPYFISYVILNAFVYNIFNYETGSLNALLRSIGLAPVNVYGTPEAWPAILTIAQSWKGLGYGSIVYLAAIAGIDKTYYEAASIDGATTWQKIFSITLPQLRPTMIIIGLLGIGNMFYGQFNLFYQMTGDNPQLFRYTDVIDTYVFRSVIRGADFGVSAAIGVLQSTFGFVTVLLANFIVRLVEPDHSLF